jgi:hypothetical protein
MKTIIQWETPCRLLHADGYRCQIERRTFAQFKKIIVATRDWPLLLDVHSEEADDVNRAAEGFRLGRTFHKHLDALRRRAGWARCAIWPASYALPDDRTARAAFVYAPIELAEVASRTAYDYEFLTEEIERRARGSEDMREALLAICVESVKKLSHPPKMDNATLEKWLALRITPKGQAKRGNTKYMGQREIGRRMKVSHMTVKRIEDQQERRGAIKTYFAKLGVPLRKTRNKHVTKRKLSS